MTFAEARALFPVLERVAYLNAGTFGPLARPTVDVIVEQARRDLDQGRSGKPYIEEMQHARATLRGAIADLLAAAPERVSLTTSTTDGCNIVLAGLGLQPDDEIVTTDAEHFGLAGPVFASGATVRVARVQQSGPDEILEAVLAEVTPRTRLLAVSHVYWTTGVVLDVHALKQQTALQILVDGAQSVGAIPVDASSGLTCGSTAFDATTELSTRNTPALATRYVFEKSVDQRSTAVLLAQPLHQQAAVVSALHVEIRHRLDQLG